MDNYEQFVQAACSLVFLCLGSCLVREGSLNFYSPILMQVSGCTYCLFKPTKYKSPILKDIHIYSIYICHLTVFTQCLDQVTVVGEEEGGGGVGEGQTKRQIVGSLDMSRSLHQTKEIHQYVPLLCIAYF